MFCLVLLSSCSKKKTSIPKYSDPPYIVQEGDLCAGQPVKLYAAMHATTYDANVFWFFGDGTSGTGTQTEHIFKEPGDYTVTVYVYPDVVTRTIHVEKC